MVTQLDFKTLNSAIDVVYDGSYIYVGTGSTLYAYSFIGNVLTQIDSISTGGTLSSFPALLIQGSYIYSHSQVTSILKAFTFDGNSFTQKASILYPGAGYMPSLGYALGTDGSYIYRSVEGNGGKKLVAYYWSSGPTLTVKTDQAVGLNFLSLVCQNGYIYGSTSTGIYKYSYNETNFTLVESVSSLSLYNSFRNMCGDGTYLFVVLGDKYSIRVYDNNLSQVGSDFEEELTEISGIFFSNGHILVTAADGVRVYTFNGSNFTLIDTITSVGTTARGAVA